MSATPRFRLLAEASIVLLAGLLSLFRSAERDFWFHLAAGRSILHDGFPPGERWCLAARFHPLAAFRLSSACVGARAEGRTEIVVQRAVRQPAQPAQPLPVI